jgi:Glycosyl hydrolases family 38 N-terminal domain
MDRTVLCGMGTLSALLVTAATSTPASVPVDTVFVVPGAHFDVGFDDLPSVVREHRIRAIDDALWAAEADPDFHWMEDGAWGFGGWLDRYRDDDRRMAAARRALRTGQLIISAVWVSPHGSIFNESLGLLTVHLDEMERLLGWRPQVAILDDAPSQPEALVDALAAHGVRYMLVGANMFLTPPLPAKLVRSPFWWESSTGARVLVYIDPNSYCQALSWPAVTDTARFANRDSFPGDPVLYATVEGGFRKLLAETTSRYDAVVFEDAFDDWNPSDVAGVPELVRAWNAAGMKPSLALASPLAYFRHIERKYGAELPVYRGEWGGQWGNIRATCPVWTWRLRQAMKLVRPDFPAQVREALATAMDHGLKLGPPRGGAFNYWQTVDNAREQARIFGRAVESASRAAGSMSAAVSLADLLPSTSEVRDDRFADAAWRDVLADSARIRVRVGPGQLVPFIPERAPVWEVPLTVRTQGRRLVASAHIDRGAIPGADSAMTFVTLEIPLRAPRGRLRTAPENSPSALAGKWLRGEPPPFVVAPEGLRVSGLAHALSVASPLAFTYTLVPDRARDDVTWLQVLLLWQDARCELKGGITQSLTFPELYPGEPQVLDMWVKVNILSE